MGAPKKGSWLFRVFLRDYTTQLYGDYVINHETRIRHEATSISWVFFRSSIDSWLNTIKISQLKWSTVRQKKSFGEMFVKTMMCPLKS